MYRQEKKSEEPQTKKKRSDLEGLGRGVSKHQRSLGLGLGQEVGGWKAVLRCGGGARRSLTPWAGVRGGTSCRRRYQPDPPLSPEEARVGSGWYPSEPQTLHTEVRPSFLRSRTSPWAGSSGAADAGGSPEWFGVGGLAPDPVLSAVSLLGTGGRKVAWLPPQGRWNVIQTQDSVVAYSGDLHIYICRPYVSSEECMDYAVTLARQAGEMAREALKNEMNIMIKSSPVDLVTATDQKVEKMLISSIKEKYPSHSFIGEESVAAGEKSILTDSPTWIIDPIDGTTNFVHGFPFVAVSIGFVVNKKMEFGIVYSCIEDKMYTGRKGKGAFCNGQKLQVSHQEDVTRSLLLTELGSSRTPETVRIILSNMERLLCLPIHGIRGVGTAALNMCLVAAGVADAYYEMGIHCWDVAGAGVIVTEAGGVLLDVTGGPFDLMSRRIIASSNKTLGERIAKEIQIIPLQRDDED
ncbi:PREDICTED: inositol monophosphatase 1 [Lipotes vexillifer]|uniref:Inositol monophosphatase 1 n=1 Tax=Lipotes vexillifer TaxID=118797 RepID=A0A340XRU2_LIPVE|nr:PREDICTED: inositol monophosphatase 1 [Lipotes vexillifer]